MKTRLPLPVFAFLLPLFAFFLLLAAAPLHAQTWLGNGTTDWGTTTNWTPNTVPNSTTATATFNGTITSQPTIGASNYTVTNLTVGSASDNVTVSGSTGNLTLTSTTSSNLLTVAANKSLTLSSNVILASALTSGGQWFPNFTADAGSVIEFASGSTLTSTITSGTATSINYLLNGSGTYNFNGAFVAGNTTAFSMRGSGTLNWDPTSTSGTPANLNNTGTDGANINVYKSAGNLGFGTAGSGTRTMTIKNTGLTFGTTVTMGNATGAAGNPFKNVLAIDNGTAAGISVSLSALTLSSNATLGTNELFAGDNDTMTFTGAITRSAGTTATTLTKSGNGTVVFMGTNTYSDNTIVSAGVLSIASTASLPGWNTNGRYSVANGAALAVYNAVSEANITAMLGTTNFAAGASIGFDTTTADRTYTANLGNTGQGALGLVKAGANDLTLTGTTTYTGDTTIRSGILKIGTSGSLGSGNYAGKITNNGFLFYTSSANQTLSGNITGTGAINKNTSTSTLTLTGNNSYTNYTYVSAGTLLINGNQTAATGGVTVAAGGTLGGNGTIGGLVTVDNNGILSPGTTADATTTLTLNTKNLTISGADSKINLNITGTADGAFDRIAGINVFAQGGDITFALTGSYVDGDLWNVFGFVSKSGTFNSVALTGDYTGSLNWDGTNWTNTNIDGQSWKFDEAAGRLSVIPEPATWALLAVSLTVVTILRRRRNS
jgi:fibronectin-binding autotransporter adhesin